MHSFLCYLSPSCSPHSITILSFFIPLSLSLSLSLFVCFSLFLGPDALSFFLCFFPPTSLSLFVSSRLYFSFSIYLSFFILFSLFTLYKWMKSMYSKMNNVKFVSLNVVLVWFIRTFSFKSLTAKSASLIFQHIHFEDTQPGSCFEIENRWIFKKAVIGSLSALILMLWNET